MRHHEVEKIVRDITGINPWEENEGLTVFIDGDHPNLVPVVRERLAASGLNFTQKRQRKTFKGATFSIPLRNVGTVWAANWEFA